MPEAELLLLDEGAAESVTDGEPLREGLVDAEVQAVTELKAVIDGVPGALNEGVAMPEAVLLMAAVSVGEARPEVEAVKLSLAEGDVEIDMLSVSVLVTVGLKVNGAEIDGVGMDEEVKDTDPVTESVSEGLPELDRDSRPEGVTEVEAEILGLPVMVADSVRVALEVREGRAEAEAETVPQVETVKDGLGEEVWLVEIVGEEDVDDETL